MVTKGYRLCDVNRSKVLYSCDVVFDESKPGVEREPKDDKTREAVEQDMYLDSGSDAESVVAELSPWMAKQRRWWIRVDQWVEDQYMKGDPLICMANE